MADTKTSALPSLSGDTAAVADLLPVVDVSASVNKALRLDELVAFLLANGITLDNLSDVVLTSPVVNEFLRHNGTNWINSVISAAAVQVDSTSILNSAATNTQDTLVDLDAAITNASAAGMPATIFDAAGDLVVASGADTAAKLTKGADETVLGVRGGTVGYYIPGLIARQFNAQTGTTFTITSAFNAHGLFTTLSNASAITLTVPTAASDTAIAVGTIFDFMQLGAGQVTVAAAGGVTVNTASSYKTRTQYSVARLVKTATNTWQLFGDLEPVGRTINAQTGTSYTFALGDMDRLVTMSNASAQTYTVPPNSSVAFPIGISIDLAQIGAGQVTVAAGVGVTVNATPTLKMRAQYSGATLIKTATDSWLLLGDLAPV